jgi:Mrp family chromosome partitioning ATPase
MAELRDILKRSPAPDDSSGAETHKLLDAPKPRGAENSYYMVYSQEKISRQEISRMREVEVHDRQELFNKRVIVPGKTETQVLNAFRQLRTKLFRLAEGKNFVLMITAPASGSGCSFVALNLAAAISLEDTRTSILIDCNFENAGSSKLIYPDTECGLSNYLSGDCTVIEEIIRPSGIPRLRFIPAGTKRNVETELFNHAKVGALFQDLKERYCDRYIIIDAPPILHSADAEILSTLCDYALLVVPYGKTTPSQIMAAANLIDEDKLMGVVFNDDPA